MFHRLRKGFKKIARLRLAAIAIYRQCILWIILYAFNALYSMHCIIFIVFYELYYIHFLENGRRSQIVWQMEDDLN